MSVHFVGETHGCYSDALQMALGPAGPGESVLEVLTGSPFGLSVYIDGRPFFAPARWTPEAGLTTALDLLGWRCERVAGDKDAAIEALREAGDSGPVLVGPVEMGLLPHHPGLGQPIGADHYLTALGLEGDMVVIHDPRAHPYATIPLSLLLAAWETDTLSYPVEPFSLRGHFTREREIEVGTALRGLLPTAAAYLEGTTAAEAAEAAADLLDGGLNTFQYFHLADFMVCVGSRRRADAADLYGGLGYTDVAATLEHQARLIGSMQYPLVCGDTATAAATMRELAPTFGRLHEDLVAAVAAG